MKNVVYIMHSITYLVIRFFSIDDKYKDYEI